MIEILSESQGNILGIKAIDKLTDQDYKEVLIPRLEAVIKGHGKASVLFCMDEDFRCWELGALWDDAKFGLKHRNDFEKMAVVGGPDWLSWGAKICAHLVRCEWKTFSAEQLAEAWKWIKA